MNFENKKLFEKSINRKKINNKYQSPNSKPTPLSFLFFPFHAKPKAQPTHIIFPIFRYLSPQNP